MKVYEGLAKSIEVEVWEWVFTHVINYGIVPFRRVRCHFIFHIVEECDKYFVNRFW